MRTSRVSSRPASRSSASIGLFVALLVLASAGVAMAATGYARVTKLANEAASHPPAATAVPQGYCQQPGWVFPPTNAFPRSH